MPSAVAGACFIVLSPYSREKSVIFGRNSSPANGEVQEVLYYAASGAQDKVKCDGGAEIDGVPSFALIMQKSQLIDGSIWGGECGNNEKNVSIGILWTEGEPKNQSLRSTDLVRLTLERSTSSSEAVDKIGSLVNSFGCDSARFSFLICDPIEAWLLSVGGKLWAAQKFQSGFHCLPTAGLGVGTTIDKSSDDLGDSLKSLGLWSGVRCSRVTRAQKDSLVDYMLEHKEFARGQFVGLNANHKSADMWESLSLQLNSMGPVVKTVEQWKKCWTDLKSGVRRCCNERKAFMQKTGGGSYREIPRELSEMEDKILQIITTHAVDGDGVTPESGVIVDIGDLDFANCFSSPSSAENWPGEEPTGDGSYILTSMFETLRSAATETNRSSSVSVLSSSGISCHWFTATPNPQESVFKPFVFAPNPKISPLTEIPQGESVTLLQKLHAKRKPEAVRDLKNLEVSCVEEVNAYLNENPTPTAELDELMKDCVEAEVKFYR